MGACYACSICGICMSIWAIIQLGVMGYFYSKEVPMLIEDVEPHEYDNYDDFIKKCELNYQRVANNCFVVSYLYYILLIISFLGMLQGRKRDKVKALKEQDDEFFCNPPVKKTWCKKKTVR